MLNYVFKRILRRPFLSLAGLVLAGALCFVLCFLVNYRDQQEADLKAMQKSYLVRGVITDARGTKANHMRLHKRFLGFIQDEEHGLGSYIENLCLVKNLECTSVLGKGYAVGISMPRADKRMLEEQGGGFYTDKENFFENEDFCCLVPETAYEEFKGGTIACSLVNPYTSAGLGTGADPNNWIFDLEVVGWYKGGGQDVIMSFPTVQRLAVRLTSTVSVDAISFDLKDSSQADLVREIASREYVTPDPSSTDFRPALTVQDKQYRIAITEMEQSIARTERLVPISLFISLAAGFLMGFLSVRGETKTYALMRTVGMGKGKLVLSVLLEQLLLPLAACLAVGFIMNLPLIALLYFACYAVGCLVAVIRPALSAPTKLLRVQE